MDEFHPESNPLLIVAGVEASDIWILQIQEVSKFGYNEIVHLVDGFKK